MPRRHPNLGIGSLLLLAAMAILLVTPARVAAHAEFDVGGGKYVMEIGFRDEPTYAGLPNAIYVHVEQYGTGGTTPVEGLASSLKAEVTAGGKTKEFALVPTDAGSYEARFVPTALGDYTFRIFGSIDGADVDQAVTSGPQTFNSAEPLNNVEFPVSQPDMAQLQAEVRAAQDAVALARTLGIAGLIVGALGLIVGIVALTRGGRPASAAAAATPLAEEPPGKLIR